MSSTNRSPARAGSALAFGLMLALGAFAPARALDAMPDLWFAGTHLIIEHPQMKAGEIAIASDDAGLARILSKAGASLTYDPKAKTVTIATADKRVIVFLIDDPHFTVDGLAQTAAFAPYASGKVVYLPLMAVAHALYVDSLPDLGDTILQPQLAWLEARSDGRVTVVTLRGATPLRFKRLADAGDGSLSLAFLGVASPLERNRQIGGASLRSIGISVSGTPRNPTTVVTFAAAPGTTIALAPSASPNEIAVAFAPAGLPLGGTPIPLSGDATSGIAPLSVRDPRIPIATPVPARAVSLNHAAPSLPPVPSSDEYAPAGATIASGANAAGGGANTAAGGAGMAAAGPLDSDSGVSSGPPVHVGAVDVASFGQGLNIRVSIDGSAGYEWHRLPDNRWYLDVKNAQLTIPPEDQALQDPSVLALRVRQIGTDAAPVVRVALTLASPREIDIVPFDGGLALAVTTADDSSGVRMGLGQFGNGMLVSAAPSPLPDATAPAAAAPWKFNAATNPKLIVIDPGHGGSDSGAMHNGLTEKDLTLDIAQRLRTILIARGWLVKMTRDSDVDVFAPNDSAKDELQARDDVANNAGARMLISVHINSFTSASLNGTTTYYYKSSDLPLAQAIHQRLVAALGTQDDGVRKENFYVIHHAKMPAVLIETAFLSNPDDAALLRSPAFLQKVAASIAAGVGDYASGTPAPLTDDGT